MTLQQPWFLLPALCLLLLYVVWYVRHDKNDWQHVIHPQVLRFFHGPLFQHRRRNTALLIAAIACAALSGPSVPGRHSDALRHSETWFVLTDVSRSMTLNDIAPNRLSGLRDTAMDIASKVNSNSIALITYAGDAFLVTPPSFDNASFTQHVALLDYGLVPADGSNLTRALSLVLSITESNALVNARIILLSDSGGMNNRAQAAVNRLYQSGHRTDIVLFGSNDASVSAPFDTDAAESLANAGGGIALLADRLGHADLDSLKLGKLDHGKNLLTQTGLVTLRLTNLSHWVLLLAVPFVLLLFYRERQS